MSTWPLSSKILGVRVDSCIFIPTTTTVRQIIMLMMSVTHYKLKISHYNVTRVDIISLK